jgi:hypothetical protein
MAYRQQHDPFYGQHNQQQYHTGYNTQQHQQQQQHTGYSQQQHTGYSQQQQHTGYSQYQNTGYGNQYATQQTKPVSGLEYPPQPDYAASDHSHGAGGGGGGGYYDDNKSIKSYASHAPLNNSGYEMSQVNLLPPLPYQQQYPPALNHQMSAYSAKSNAGYSAARDKLMNRRSMRQVELQNGNLVLDVHVPSNIVPPQYSDVEEMIKVCYSSSFQFDLVDLCIDVLTPSPLNRCDIRRQHVIQMNSCATSTLCAPIFTAARRSCSL